MRWKSPHFESAQRSTTIFASCLLVLLTLETAPAGAQQYSDYRYEGFGQYTNNNGYGYEYNGRYNGDDADRPRRGYAPEGYGPAGYGRGVYGYRGAGPDGNDYGYEGYGYEGYGYAGDGRGRNLDDEPQFEPLEYNSPGDNQLEYNPPGSNSPGDVGRYGPGNVGAYGSYYSTPWW